MTDCIFCKIAKGEIPSSKIYEDKEFLAFLDINPVTNGHLMVIPKKHFVWMQEADDETIAGIFKVCKKIMLVLKKGLGCDYVHVSVVGKDVPHFHIHLMPRYLDDSFASWPTKKYKDGAKEEVAQKITQAL